MVSRARRSRHAARKERAGFRLGIVGIVIAAILGIGCLGTLGVCFVWLQNLPDYTDASAYNVAEKTKVYASDGTTLLAELYLENRDPIELSEMGDYVTQGTVATEDERFYEHNGVDLWGILRAVWVNVTGTGHEGASTITQQFVRNTILSDEMQESTLKRKVREAYIAIQLEQMYSKEEILSVLRTGHHTSYGHRYELICADVSWDEARELCMEKGGYLATITSPAEQDIVQKQIEDENLQEISFYVGYRRAEWVGDEFMEPRWINADESFTSADHMHGFWKYSLPEYDYEQSQWEDTVCGLIKYVGGIYLYDAPDNLVEVSPEYSGKMGYICEFDD